MPTCSWDNIAIKLKSKRTPHQAITSPADSTRDSRYSLSSLWGLLAACSSCWNDCTASSKNELPYCSTAEITAVKCGLVCFEVRTMPVLRKMDEESEEDQIPVIFQWQWMVCCHPCRRANRFPRHLWGSHQDEQHTQGQVDSEVSLLEWFVLPWKSDCERYKNNDQMNVPQMLTEFWVYSLGIYLWKWTILDQKGFYGE